MSTVSERARALLRSASHLTAEELETVERARDLSLFCDGLEAAGLEQIARPARFVARGALELAVALEGERSARGAS